MPEMFVEVCKGFVFCIVAMIFIVVGNGFVCCICCWAPFTALGGPAFGIWPGWLTRVPPIRIEVGKGGFC